MAKSLQATAVGAGLEVLSRRPDVSELVERPMKSPQLMPTPTGQNAMISVNKVHFPVTTLGYGRRVAIWTQGCSIRCPGCISRDTWETRPDQAIPVPDLVAGIHSWLAEADGVTVSGGEPFDQPDALAALIHAIRRVHRGDVLVYSGHSHQWLLSHHPFILAVMDVLISEPYRPEAGSTLTLRGSDNQRVFLLSDLARQRYPADLDRRRWAGERRLEVMIYRDEVWMAGIPEPDAMRRFKERLAARGFSAAASDEFVPRIQA